MQNSYILTVLGSYGLKLNKVLYVTVGLNAAYYLLLYYLKDLITIFL